MQTRQQAIQEFVNDLKKDSMVHKHLASEKGMPVMINMDESVTLLWNTNRNLYDKWIERVVSSHSIVDYGYFKKGTGSYPSRIVFVFT